MVNPVEMASAEAHVPEQLKGIPGYGDAFAKAFPGEPDPITLANVQKTIRAGLGILGITAPETM